MDDFRADVARTVKGEDDNMQTYEQWREYMDRYRQELRAGHDKCWAEKELDAAVAGSLVRLLEVRRVGKTILADLEGDMGVVGTFPTVPGARVPAPPVPRQGLDGGHTAVRQLAVEA